MPARKIVVRRKKTVSHRKPVHHRPAPKMLPVATTTAIVNKVLAKNGIHPGTPMHKKLLPSLKAFALKHKKGFLVGSHVGAFAAGAAAGHYATRKNNKGVSGWNRVKAVTPEWLKAGESKWNVRRFIFGQKEKIERENFKKKHRKSLENLERKTKEIQNATNVKIAKHKAFMNAMAQRKANNAEANAASKRMTTNIFSGFRKKANNAEANAASKRMTTNIFSRIGK